MEIQGILDPGVDSDIYCLRRVFSKLLQDDLDFYRITWNNHKLRTCKNKTPTQLWTLSMHEMKSQQEETGVRFTELDQVRF